MASACACGRIQPCPVHPQRKRSSTGHWGAAYRAERDRLLPRWNADPSTRCHICGGPALAGDPWEPDHGVEADAGGGLVGNLFPAHRSCNRAKGARYAASKRKAKAEARAQARIDATYRHLEGAAR